MRFEIVTIFPGFFSSVFEHGVMRRALAEELAAVRVHDLRAFTHDRHRTVDDRPFGGGEGMVLKPEPLAEALAALGVASKLERSENAEEHRKDVADPSTPTTRVVLFSAQGRRFDQALARELARLDRVVLICGRYEGVDERINELYCDLELSIGDYVLSGGELAAAVVLDVVMRLIPGVLGNQASAEFESFGLTDSEIAMKIRSDNAVENDPEIAERVDAGCKRVPRSQHGSGGLLDYPHYTRPADFAGLRVPEVLVNGDHGQIRRWRREQQLRKTLLNRPDLLEHADLSDEDRRLLEAIRGQRK
jgi:tRNA (guanine37-N1)-methyltransferase